MFENAKVIVLNAIKERLADIAVSCKLDNEQLIMQTNESKTVNLLSFNDVLKRTEIVGIDSVCDEIANSFDQP